MLTFDGMVSCGITKRFPISLHRNYLRTINLRKPLKPACTLPCVSGCLNIYYPYSYPLSQLNRFLYILV